MDLRQLRYFVAVAESGNISRAAQRMFLTQPALSRQIKALEDEVGHLLLERQAHSIGLTAVGEVLLREARELLQKADIVLERVRATAQGVRLRVGYAPSLAIGLLSEAVESFMQRHPNTRVDLSDLSTQEMLAGLEANTLDVALTIAPERETRGMRWVKLATVSWKLAVNTGHALVRAAKVTPAQVVTSPLLAFCRRDYPEYWEIITGWLRSQGEKGVIGCEYDGVNSLLAAVESGLGVAVVTTNVTRFVPKRVRLKSFSAAPKPVSIVAGLRADRANDGPCAVFVEELRHAASALGRTPSSRGETTT